MFDILVVREIRLLIAVGCAITSALY